MTDWLAIESVDFRYGDQPVIEGLTLTLSEQSRVLAILGPSGVGKSTLLALIAGHLKPTRGTISVHGQIVRRPDASRPVVFQDHNLFPWMTVLDNVVFGLKCLAVPLAERRRQGRELLRLMHLDGIEALYPAVLSGGMRQRVSLARALAVNPACLLLDEPFQGLDPLIRDELQSELATLVVGKRTRAVMVTHDLEEAARIADHVLIIRGVSEHELVRTGPRLDEARTRDPGERVSDVLASDLRKLFRSAS
jgi:NitT/TauT family transport system ATP-binding protein